MLYTYICFTYTEVATDPNSESTHSKYYAPQAKPLYSVFSCLYCMYVYALCAAADDRLIIVLILLIIIIY
jgi:hypothetical protein